MLRQNEFNALLEIDKNILCQFINDIYGIDKQFDKRIERLLLQSDKPALIKKLTSTVKGLKRRKKFITYWDSSEFAFELEQLLNDIITLQNSHADKTLELLTLFIDSTENSMNRCDDSNGSVGGVYIDASLLWLDVAHVCYEQNKRDTKEEDLPILSNAWITKLITLADENDYGTMDELLPNANKVFNNNELERIVEHYQLKWAEYLQNNATDDGYDFMASRFAINIKSLADAMGDVQLYEQTYLKSNQDADRETLNARQMESLVAFFIKHDAPERALDYLGTIDKIGLWKCDEHDEVERLEFLDTVYKSVNDNQQRLNVLSKLFEIRPSVTYLQKVLPLIEKKEIPFWHNKAKELVKNIPFAHEKILILIEINAVDLATETAIDYFGELADNHYNTLTTILKETPDDAYLLQVILYRCLLDDILNNARTKGYKIGRGYLEKLTALDFRITSYNTIANHTEYTNVLRTLHGKKRSFWDKIKDEI